MTKYIVPACEDVIFKEFAVKGNAVEGYGAFVNTVVDFLIVAFCIFLMVKGINILRRTLPTEKGKA